MMGPHLIVLKFGATFIISLIMITASNYRASTIAEEEPLAASPAIDFVRVAIVIDNSTNAAVPWRQTSSIFEATAKFFTFYDRKLLANQTRFVVSILKVPLFDDPLTATFMLCRRLQKETNLVGIVLTDSTPTFRGFLAELSRFTTVPVIELFTISSLSMMPDSSHFHFYMCDFLIPAIQEAIEAYRLINVLLIYDTTLNLACVNQLIGNPKQIGHALALAVTDANFYEIVYTIKMRWQSVIIACDEARTIRFLQLALRMGILSPEYSFIFTNPDIHLYSMEEFAHNQPNVTFFRYVRKTNFTMEVIQVAHEFEELQPKYKILAPPAVSRYGVPNILLYDQEIQISLPSAMLFDVLLLLRTTVEGLLLNSGLQHWTDSGSIISCRNPITMVHGKTINNALLRQSIEGLTGLIKFNKTSRLRDTFVIEVLGLGSVGLRKIGLYSSEAVTTHGRRPGLQRQLKLDQDITMMLHQSPAFIRPNKTEELTERRPLVTVTTLLEKPYVMYRGDRSKKKSFYKSRALTEHNFEGYCVDLLEEIATIVGFDYSIHLVGDGRYGSLNISTGKWNGMIGEVIDGKATMAVAPLTITYAREQVVDFTKPFINLGIAILYVAPFKTNPQIFSFMHPLAGDVWMAVAVAFVTVTIVFYVIGHFVDWAHLGEEEERMRAIYSLTGVTPARQRQSKLFSLINSAHFTIGGIVHHGSTVVPTTWPTRVISVFWWFFAMIIISSYTANLAAFLTVETLISPFENAEEMASQTKVVYGTLKGGATENFFRESKIETYRQMWAFMKDKDVFTRNNSEGIERVKKSKGAYAYLMESVSMDYIIANDNKECQLRQVGSLLDSKGYGIATAKDSPILHEVSMAILQLQENDRLQLLYEKWWKAGGQSCQQDDNVAKALKIQNVYGVFVILAVGLFCSLWVLPLEILWYHRKKRNPKDRRSYSQRVRDSLRFRFLSLTKRRFAMKMHNCVRSNNSNGYVNDANIWQARRVAPPLHRLARRNAFRAQQRNQRLVQLHQATQSLDRDSSATSDYFEARWVDGQRSASLTIRNAPRSSIVLSPLTTFKKPKSDDENTTGCRYWHLHRSHSFKEISV